MTIRQLLQVGLDEQPSVEIGPATEAELAAVTGEFAADGKVRCQIEEWHLIAIRVHVLQQTTLHLVGRYEPLRRLITSPVVSLAFDRRHARTLNSVYALAQPAAEPPSRDTLLRIAARMLVRASVAMEADNTVISREVGHA